MKFNFKALISLTALATLSLTTLITSCKKKGCTNENATNFDSKAKKDDGSCVLPSGQSASISETTTFIVNDTIDFSTTGNDYEWSTRLTRTGIDTSTTTPTYSYFAFSSIDSNTIGFFTVPNRKIEFAAGYGAFLISEYTNGNTQLAQARKYSVNDVIDGSGNSFGTPNGIASNRILEDNVQSSFTQNATQYLGLHFNDNNQNYYGWVKIKTLNNNYSCVIVSYNVAQEPNQSVTIK